MSKKKSKKCQSSTNSKWIQMRDGTFSLVIETKKPAASQISHFSEVNNNKLKGLVTKRQPNEKKPEGENVTIENITHQNTDLASAFEHVSGDELCLSQPDAPFGLTDNFSTLQISDNQSITNSEKSDKSDESFALLNCVQNIDFEIETQADSFVSAIETEDSGHEEFYENLFADSKPKLTYVTATTDIFPCDDESDSDSITSHTVKFFLDNGQWMAEYKHGKYQIGHLDLTTDEHDILKFITEAPIELEFNPNNIIVRRNRLYIMRIEEQQTTLNSSHSINLWFAILNLVRIQFSTTEPFLAKYENEIYFVGKKLYEEYMYLLLRAKKNPGTAIRLCKDRIEVCLLSRTLDINETTPFDKQTQVCVIAGQKEPTTNSLASHGEFRRYIVNSNPYEVLEVEPTLLHSSMNDNCTEIYAEIDFPFNEKEPEIEEKTVTWDKEAEELDLASYEPLEMVPLKSYAVPPELRGIAYCKNFSMAQLLQTKYGKIFQRDTLRKDVNDYVKAYKLMIWLEEDEQSVYLTEFNRYNIELTYFMDRQFYCRITDPQFIAAVEENVIDRFVLTPKSIMTKIKTKDEIWGQVLRVKDQKLYIEIFPESINAVRNAHRHERFDMTFTLNRLPYQLQHYALDFIKNETLFTRLIDNSFYRCKNEKLSLPNSVEITGKSTLKYEGTLLNELNTEQQSAVKNIIDKVDKLPYVLFGPPGTGKTRTLVAAIEQIVRTTNQNVLVCATSNTACDELAERLVKVLKNGEMYRFYAKSYKNDKVNRDVVQNSNYCGGRIFYPSLKYIYRFRVFICTLCSAGCLTRARKDEKVWRPDHFGYVIIDECASAPETMSLIPIAGLCTSNKEIYAKVVIAGDPKQLDAVTRSDRAKKLGYNTSWLEQLCNTNLYSRNTITDNFNETYITQLVKNYRSHPHILSIPNELFYENKLQAYAPQGQTNWYINSSFLPSKQFPMIFRSVKGICVQSIEHSWYNDLEIEEVINVIRNLLPPRSMQYGLKRITQMDIGVVTPYRKQRYRLAQRLRRLNFDQVTVGTAEVFQGKEKPIIIITTVRSNGQLGFVGEPRRLNVVITRAKCLVVIVGDPQTLQLDENWRRVIEFCKRNNSFI